MQDIFLTLDEAADLEGVDYDTFQKKIRRKEDFFNLSIIPNETGGRDRKLIALTSLSKKAQRKYKEKLTPKLDFSVGLVNPPWYVDADLEAYIKSNKEQYYKAVELSAYVEKFINAWIDDRTDYATAYANELGVSQRTLYRWAEEVQLATAWALKKEAETGSCYDFFKALSLCRKPREVNTFPSLTVEQKTVIEYIWFNKSFAANLGTQEMLYDKFVDVALEREWTNYPSLKTVSRYIKYLMSLRGAANAHYLAANGLRDFKGNKMLKCKRDSKSLEVMELIVGDEHTFDLWVKYTAPNGKVRAVKPKLIAWMDMRSRCIVGDVICIDANSQLLKESLVKMMYSHPGGVPKAIKIDNGKDYTSETMTGQNRKDRYIEFAFDGETKGFYQSIGIQEVTRSLPYQAWDKPIERFFGTVCSKFSKQFESYTGTLTGSKTYCKRKKDIDKMLEKDELLTMEEFFEVWTRWKDEKYHKSVHSSLKKAKEKWTTPIECFGNSERYKKAAPPRDYAAMLLMKADTARVTSQGITKFGTLYTHYELCHYIGKSVGVKWDLDDVSKLYVYDEKGSKICMAESAELMMYGNKVSQPALEEHKRKQNTQIREYREMLNSFSDGYKALQSDKATSAVGSIDITIKADRPSKVITLPEDKEYRAEIMGKTKAKKHMESEFLQAKASDALSMLRAINE